MTITQFTTGTFYTCCKVGCGVIYALESGYEDLRREDHAVFYCPNGHGQSFSGEDKNTRITRLENEKRLEREKVERLERDAKILREEAFKANEKSKRLRTAIKKKSLRIKNGLCPHCDRSFENLQRHMTTKHTGCKSAKGYKTKKAKLP